MEELDKIFKSKLENYTETPPPEILSKISDNLPKNSFKQLFIVNKWKIVAAVSIVSVLTTIIIIATNNKLVINEQSLSHTNKSIHNAFDVTTDAEQTLNYNVNDNASACNLDSKNPLNVVPENILEKPIFTDTIICGNEYIAKGLKLENIRTSNNIKVSENAFGVHFYTEKAGVYKIYYYDNSRLCDSANLTFVSNKNINAILSKNILCEGEKLQVTLDSDARVLWNDDFFDVTKLSQTKYELSNFASSNQTIEITVDDKYCPLVQTFDVQIIAKPTISILTSPEICNKRNGELKISADKTVDSYKIGSMYSTNGNFDNLQAGMYKVEINYGASCLEVRDVSIESQKLLRAKFDTEKDVFVANKFSFINQSLEFGQIDVSYKWFINGVQQSKDYNFEHIFAKNGNYKVELRASVDGCTDVFSKALNVDVAKFSVPNIFTPNGDGISDEFVISYNVELYNFHIMIYTQAGQLVFESNDIDISWDGKVSGNNDASEGVYFYVLKAITTEGENITEKGTIQLKRN